MTDVHFVFPGPAGLCRFLVFHVINERNSCIYGFMVVVSEAQRDFVAKSTWKIAIVLIQPGWFTIQFFACQAEHLATHEARTHDVQRSLF